MGSSVASPSRALRVVVVTFFFSALISSKVTFPDASPSRALNAVVTFPEVALSVHRLRGSDPLSKLGEPSHMLKLAFNVNLGYLTFNDFRLLASADPFTGGL